MANYQGRLLIGAPDLADPNFYRSVVLLVSHDEEGALGVVLNRPTQTPLSQVWEQVGEGPCLREAFLHVGGPCEGLLSAVHTDAEAGQLEVTDGLYFTAEAPLLTRLVECESAPGLAAGQGGLATGVIEARFFIGYAGWGPGQLEAEVEGGGWLLTPASKADPFAATDDIWPRTLKRINPAWASLTFNPGIVPEDPNQN